MPPTRQKYFLPFFSFLSNIIIWKILSQVQMDFEKVPLVLHLPTYSLDTKMGVAHNFFPTNEKFETFFWRLYGPIGTL